MLLLMEFNGRYTGPYSRLGRYTGPLSPSLWMLLSTLELTVLTSMLLLEELGATTSLRHITGLCGLLILEEQNGMDRVTVTVTTNYCRALCQGHG